MGLGSVVVERQQPEHDKQIHKPIMPRASIYKKNKNVQKGLKNRRNGLMRKANTFHLTYNAPVAVLMQYGGRWYTYESRAGLLRSCASISPQSRFDPRNFETDRDGQETPHSSSVDSASGNNAELSPNSACPLIDPVETFSAGHGITGVVHRPDNPPRSALPGDRRDMTLHHLAEMELLADNLFSR